LDFRVRDLEAVDTVTQPLGLVVVLARHRLLLELVDLANLDRGDCVDVEVQSSGFRD
jgi:hypothetical protein